MVALSILLILYGFARLPSTSTAERQQLAHQFHFSVFDLPQVTKVPNTHIRPVNPNLEHVSGWISAVGAGVALNDIDGDGLANDLCYVEVRTNQVIVASVPNAKKAYSSQVLNPKPLVYNETMAPMGCVPADLNRDGKMDLLVYYWGRQPIVFIQKPHFHFVPIELDQGGLKRWFANAATVADIDGDGLLDIVIGTFFQDDAHILDPNATVPDAMQNSLSRAYNGGGTYFFLGQANKTFKRIDGSDVLSAKANHAWTLAIGAADLDGDLLPELYFANDFGPDRLLHNRSTPGHLKFALLEGQRSLTMPSSKVLGKDSFKGMGVDFADINHDGYLDIFVGNIAEEE